ncbi:intracellular protein transport protein [Reticulomyxa filosa]|uniref:Intracellular protein transport protein n=1 Tax=Reticulomyxa filosa TaxID=46433 RepID=X6PE18_RETFI|nr:intracellular protein transport protein [Reticulomyxa filosa]|eukprot:ETO36304.1 intracellular protein transport protein [Reticulomyxa filosa]
MNDEETKRLLQQLTEKRKELAKCKTELRKLAGELKSVKTLHENQIKRLQMKVEKLEKNNQEQMAIKSDVAKKMKGFQLSRSATSSNVLQEEQLLQSVGSPNANSMFNFNANASAEDIAVQKATAKLRKDFIKLQKEMDKEKEANNNLQQRLARALKLKKDKNDNDNEGSDALGGPYSQRKVRRLENELQKRDMEIVVKQRKLDQLFLRLKETETRLDAASNESARMKSTNATLRKQLEHTQAQLRVVTRQADDNTRNVAQLNEATKQITHLSGLNAKLKLRLTRLQSKSKQFVKQLDAFQEMQAQSYKLERELAVMENRRQELESKQSSSEQANTDLEQHMLQVKDELARQQQTLDSVTVQLNQSKQEMDVENGLIVDVDAKDDQQGPSAESSSSSSVQEQGQVQSPENATQTKDKSDSNDGNGEDEKNKAKEKEKEKEKKEEEESIEVKLAKTQAMLEHAEKVIQKYKQKVEALEKENEQVVEGQQIHNIEMEKKESEMTDIRIDIQNRIKQIELLTERNKEMEQMLITTNSEKLRETIAERDEQVSELQNDLKKSESESKELRERLDSKGKEWSELLSKWESLSRENESNTKKVESLTNKIEQLDRKLLTQGDDVEVKLQSYEKQVVLMQKSNKEVEALEQQLGNLRTQYELLNEKCERIEKQKQEMSQQCDQKDETIDALNLKIKEFKKQLEMSGIGVNKNAGELGLLRKNVAEMESIIKTKDFQIRKLQNQSSWSGTDANGNATTNWSSPEDLEKIKSLESELQKNKLKMERFVKEFGEMKVDLEKSTLEKQSMESLLNKKNVELIHLKTQADLQQDTQKLVQNLQDAHNEELKRHLLVVDEKLATIRELEDRLKDQDKELRKLKKYEETIEDLTQQLEEKNQMLLRVVEGIEENASN